MRLLSVVLVLGLLALPAQLRGEQATRGREADDARVRRHIEEGDGLHDRLQPRDALEAYRAALEVDPLAYDALWRAAREAVNVGMLAEDGEPKEWYATAESYAQRAVRVGPGSPEGHHWLSVAMGRRALHEGIRTRVRLAGQVRDEARITLTLDSLHAGGHHVLGQWHAEVMRLGGVSRFVAETVLGGDAFEQASWEEAERHLVRAVELDPHFLLHRLELARIYRDTDRPERARALLEEILERPAVEPTDPLHKQEAQELLRKLG